MPKIMFSFLTSLMNKLYLKKIIHYRSKHKHFSKNNIEIFLKVL